MAKVRGMAAEFRASFDELARQSELDELRREVQALRVGRPLDLAARHLGAGDVLSDISGDLGAANAEIAAHTAALAAPPTAPVLPPISAEAAPALPTAQPATADPPAHDPSPEAPVR
jgi:sec-independent protein translocase protein TatB